MPRLQNALRSTIQNSMRTTRTTRNQRANEVNSFVYQEELEKASFQLGTLLVLVNL